MHGSRKLAKAQFFRGRENLSARATSPRRPSFDHVAAAERKNVLCALALFITQQKR